MPVSPTFTASLQSCRYGKRKNGNVCVPLCHSMQMWQPTLSVGARAHVNCEMWMPIKENVTFSHTITPISLSIEQNYREMCNRRTNKLASDNSMCMLGTRRGAAVAAIYYSLFSSPQFSSTWTRCSCECTRRRKITYCSTTDHHPASTRARPTPISLNSERFLFHRTQHHHLSFRFQITITHGGDHGTRREKEMASSIDCEKWSFI